MSGEHTSGLSALPPALIIVGVLVACVFERREDSAEVKDARGILMSHCPSREAMQAGTNEMRGLAHDLVPRHSASSLPVEVDSTLEATPTPTEIIGHSSWFWFEPRRSRPRSGVPWAQGVPWWSEPRGWSSL